MPKCPLCTNGTVWSYGRPIPCPMCYGWLYPILVGEIKRMAEFGYSPGIEDFVAALQAFEGRVHETMKLMTGSESTGGPGPEGK